MFGAEKDNIGRRTQVLKNLVGVRTLRQQFVNDLCEWVVVKGGGGGLSDNFFPFSLNSQMVDSLTLTTTFNCFISMQVNLIITSDHGMTSVSDKRVIYLSDCNITANMYTLVDTGPPHLGTTAAILPHPGKLDLIYSKLKNGCHPHMTVYKKEDIPERYHYTHNRRITPILAVADEGWQITSDRHQHLGHHKGNHGYSNSVSSMHPFFIARGPAFKEGYLSEPFRNVDIYPLICDILGITPAPNNGSLLQVKHLLKPNNNGAKQNYSMLVFLVIVIFIVFGLMSYGIVSFCANHHCKMRRYGQIYDLGTDDFDL